MKMSYYLRVFIVSYELVFLVVCLASYIFSQELLSEYFPLTSLNDDAVNWAMLFPVGIAGWTLKEGIGVIFPSEKDQKTLHEWPGYWKLKAHFDVGIFNSIVFILPCMAVWLLSGINTFIGAWVFVAFAGALSINAYSFYAAKISVKSALIRLNSGHDYNERVNGVNKIE